MTCFRDLGLAAVTVALKGYTLNCCLSHSTVHGSLLWLFVELALGQATTPWTCQGSCWGVRLNSESPSQVLHYKRLFVLFWVSYRRKKWKNIARIAGKCTTFRNNTVALLYLCFHLKKPAATRIWRLSLGARSARRGGFKTSLRLYGWAVDFKQQHSKCASTSRPGSRDTLMSSLDTEGKWLKRSELKTQLPWMFSEKLSLCMFKEGASCHLFTSQTSGVFFTSSGIA